MTHLEILKRYWGYDDFRGIQADIIRSIASGCDTLGLMPTGGGKSITFQVPALAMEGTCIVVTPLIALMKDQVEHLRKRGIRAAAIYSGMRRDDIVKTLENCIFGAVKLLYISPERIASDIFQTKLRRIRVSFITVDEAHCISQWGYDFRPSYLSISVFRELKPEAPILALTATATPRVVDDIQRCLAFRPNRSAVFRMSFHRPNLSYVVRDTDDKQRELVHILTHVPGCAIVYVRNRKSCRDIAALLVGEGISTTYYHAGLDHADRDFRQRKWQSDECRVMVATNAFGMGIDKPDVRLVVHIESPDSIEAYFQEAGRAGRDGAGAYAVLLHSRSDDTRLRRRIDDNYPPREFIADVYSHLAYFYEIAVGTGQGATFAFDIARFCTTYHFFPTRVDAALHLLTAAGYLLYETEPESTARARFLLSRNDLYRLDNLSGDEDAVVMALLRTYGGLFTDYQYIQLSDVALLAALTPDQVYQALRLLHQKSIVSFIPQRSMPTVRFLRPRVDNPVLSPEVYDHRRQDYADRISAILTYVGTHNVCRVQMLLRYFGETKFEPCGKCDVCRSEHAGNAVSPNTVANIMAVLSDGNEHTLNEIYKRCENIDEVDKAVRRMIAEEMVEVNINTIRIVR